MTVGGLSGSLPLVTSSGAGSPARRSLAVTGGSGFVGRAVVQMLRERGHVVFPVVRMSCGDPTERFVYDITDRPGPEKTFAGVDTVIHLFANQLSKSCTSTGGPSSLRWLAD